MCLISFSIFVSPFADTDDTDSVIAGKMELFFPRVTVSDRDHCDVILALASCIALFVTHA